MSQDTSTQPFLKVRLDTRPEPRMLDDSPTATLRALSYDSRAAVDPLLTQALKDCDCWTLERSGDAVRLCLVFELAVRQMIDLYPSLIGCGLEFDRKGHEDLALLCTLGKHVLEQDGLRRHVTLRLELTFVEELEAGLFSVPPRHA